MDWEGRKVLEVLSDVNGGETAEGHFLWLGQWFKFERASLGELIELIEIVGPQTRASEGRPDGLHF